jgi:molecular chaperone HscA
LREQRVEAERVLTEAGRQLGEHAELLADGERPVIEAAMAKVREVAKGNDHHALKESIHALDEVCKPFVERVMNQALTKVVAGHSVEEF